MTVRTIWQGVLVTLLCLTLSLQRNYDRAVYAQEAEVTPRPTRTIKACHICDEELIIPPTATPTVTAPRPEEHLSEVAPPRTVVSTEAPPETTRATDTATARDTTVPTPAASPPAPSSCLPPSLSILILGIILYARQ